MTGDALYELGRRVKLVVCDLDGTLLNSGKQISAASVEAVQGARQRGVQTTFCTGRIHDMTLAYSRRMNIEGPMAAANGAVILDAQSGAILYKKTIPAAAALAVVSFCGQKGMDCSLLASEGCFFSRNSVRRQRFEQYNRIAEADGLPPLILRSLDDGFGDALSCDIYKILIYEIAEGQKKTAEAFLASFPELARTSSEEGLLDVSAAGVDKGRALRRLARIAGVSKGEICVFGDYCNDIPMMDQAGFPIAMGNAPEEVQLAALAVTASNDEDGVARGIEKYILQTGGRSDEI